MPEKRRFIKPDDDVVSSIFDRSSKKKELSSIFNSPKKTSAQEPLSTPSIDKQAPSPPARRPRKTPKKSRRAQQKKQLPIGIDIGTGSIKIVQLAPIDDKYQISKLAIKEFSPDLIDSPTKRLQLLPIILRGMIEENNLKGDVYSAVSLGIARIKNITLPKMPRAEIDGTVKWEIQQTDKTNIDELSFDYTILDEDRINQLDKIELLVVTSPKKEIFKHLNLLESVGLNVLAVEVEPLSLLASLNYNHSINPDEVIILLDLGADATQLNIIANNELYFSRVLSVNGNSLTMAIRDYCHVSSQEAEELKRKYGLSAVDSISTQDLSRESKTSKPTQVKEAISLSLEKLVADIERTFKYFSFQLTKSAIPTYNKVILSGGSANLKMFASFLSNRLNVPVETANPLSSLGISQEALSQVNSLEKEAVRFGVAVGLALRGIEQRK